MKTIAIEEHFLSPDVRAAWAAAASANDASASLHLGDMQDRLEEFSGERLARMNESRGFLPCNLISPELSP